MGPITVLKTVLIITVLTKCVANPSQKHRRMNAGEASDETLGNVQFGQWETAYHWVGWFKDCSVDGDMHQKYGDEDERRRLSGSKDDGKCALWGIWATYGLNQNMYPDEPDNFYDFWFNPEDSVNGESNPQHYMCALDEVQTDENQIPLDCHTKTTNSWLFLGFLREDAYHCTEQVMKHVWGFNCWDYPTWIASRECPFAFNCGYLATADDGTDLYAGPAPKYGGRLIIGLHTDEDCLYPTTKYGNADDWGLKDYHNDYSESPYNYYSGFDDGYNFGGNVDGCTDDVFCDYPTEESGVNFETNCDYALTNFNLILQTFVVCRNCVIYPTFQDGDLTSGVEDGYQHDELINQCWKFWSHNAYWCSSTCAHMAASQGGLVSMDHIARWNGKLNYGSPKSGKTNKSGAIAFVVALCALAASAFALSLVKKRKKNLGTENVDSSIKKRKKSRKTSGMKEMLL